MAVSKKINTYQYGNTIRFECDFFDFNGQLIDPQLIKITVYSYKYEVLFTEVLGLNNRKNIGEYFYDYTTERKDQKLFYEWYGEIDSKPSLKRGEFMTKFI